jgi:hypothetical protein
MPGWFMAGVWLLFWISITLWFEEAPQPPASYFMKVSKQSSNLSLNEPVVNGTDPDSTLEPLEVNDNNNNNNNLGDIVQESDDDFETRNLTLREIAVSFTMCLAAYTTFFELGSWESMIPVYGAEFYSWTPVSAGNFIGID